MVDATYIDQNRVQIIKGDDIAFDTNRPSITLLPDSQRIVISSFQIDFPSPIQRAAYYRSARSNLAKCELWSTFIWQEWGPGESTHNERYYPVSGVQDRPGPTARNLPRVTLGTVPAGTSYIDVRVNLTRTKTPANMIGFEPPVCMLPQGEWFTSPGGSFLTEFFHPLARHFDIVLDGTTVYLDRYQSVKNGDTLLAPGGNPQRNISSDQSGWDSRGVTGANTNSDGTANSELAPKTNYYLAGLMDFKDYSTDGTKRPNGTNPCRGSFPDFQSIYTGDIIITPGRYTAAT